MKIQCCRRRKEYYDKKLKDGGNERSKLEVKIGGRLLAVSVVGGGGGHVYCNILNMKYLIIREKYVNGTEYLK